MDISNKGGCQAFRARLAQGSPESANRYWMAKKVAEAKTRVWEEYCETMERDYQMASKRFWQTVR